MSDLREELIQQIDTLLDASERIKAGGDHWQGECLRWTAAWARRDAEALNLQQQLAEAQERIEILRKEKDEAASFVLRLLPWVRIYPNYSLAETVELEQLREEAEQALRRWAETEKPGV